MSKITEFIATLRRLHQEASAGPWEVTPNDDNESGAENSGHIAIKAPDQKDAFDSFWHIARVWQSGPNPSHDAQTTNPMRPAHI